MTIHAPMILAALDVSDRLCQEAIIAVKTLALSNEDLATIDKRLAKFGDTFDLLELAVYDGLHPPRCA